MFCVVKRCFVYNKACRRFGRRPATGKHLKKHKKSAKNRRVIGIKTGLYTSFADFCSYGRLFYVYYGQIDLKQLKNHTVCSHPNNYPAKRKQIDVIVLMSFDWLLQAIEWTRFANFKANRSFIPRFR
jgi:hypothetical protein